MSRTWTQGQQRAAALLLLLLVVGGVLAALILPVWSANARYTETLADMSDRLERLQRVAATRDGLQSRYTDLQRQQGQDVYYLQSESEALATAELQRIAKQGITDNGGLLLSTQVISSQVEEGFTRATIRVRMRGSLEAVVKALYGFETGTPLLFLDNLSMRGTPGMPLSRLRRQSTLRTDMNVDFELSGYLARAKP